MYLSFYIVTTTTDFTGCGLYVVIGIIVVLLLGLLGYLFKIPFTNALVAGILLFLYGISLISTTQAISGKFGNYYSFDDAYLASLSLCLNVVQIFYESLRLVS